MQLFRRILCTVLLALLLSGCSAEDQQYRQGKSALAAGRLAEAAGCFGALGDYKDCTAQLQAVYDRAMELYNAGAYPEAATAFLALAEYDVFDARNYAAASGALACLESRDGSGVRAALAQGDADSPPVSQAAAQADKLLFPGTPIFRPEFVARELVSGELSAEIREASDGSGKLEYLYAMDQKASDRVYQQYREYCMEAFPDTLRDESEHYFSFRADGILCYVSNFYSVDGGMVILIPAT